MMHGRHEVAEAGRTAVQPTAFSLTGGITHWPLLRARLASLVRGDLAAAQVTTDSR
jgi:hypothetical protein